MWNMNSCSQCGIELPKGQNICSMCYGDPYYGTDGYYINFLYEEVKQAQEEKEWEVLMEEEERRK